MIKFYFPVYRVKNLDGPQTVMPTKRAYTNALDKLMVSPIKIKQEPSGTTDNDVEPKYIPLAQPSHNADGIQERLQNAEVHLNVASGLDKSIFERLKAIENRIMYLETVSPEYNHFMVCLFFCGVEIIIIVLTFVVFFSLAKLDGFERE